MLFGTILVFFYVFFCCLFVLAPRTVFYGFLCDFELIFDSISGVFCSKVEVVFFATTPKQNHDFQGSRASIFQCFFPIFSTSHSGLHFSSFFGDFRVAKAPVLELVGLIFRHQKNESKNGLRLFATRRDATRGGPFKQDNRFLQKQLFNISSLQRCLKARWRISESCRRVLGGGIVNSWLHSLFHQQWGVR